MAARAPVVDDAAIWACCVATAMAGGMPRKIRSGVIRKPPPIPNRPETKPDRRADAEDHQHADGHLGDGQVDLHDRVHSPER